MRACRSSARASACSSAAGSATSRGFALALDRQVGGDIAAPQRLAGCPAQRRLQRVPAGWQAEAQIEPPAIDAAQFPRPGEARGAAFGPGEACHRSERGTHVAGLLSAIPRHEQPPAAFHASLRHAILGTIGDNRTRSDR